MPQKVEGEREGRPDYTRPTQVIVEKDKIRAMQIPIQTLTAFGRGNFIFTQSSSVYLYGRQESPDIGGKTVQVYWLQGSGNVTVCRPGASVNAYSVGTPYTILTALDPIGNTLGTWTGPINWPLRIKNVGKLIAESGIVVSFEASEANPVYAYFALAVTCHYEVLEKE
jgi:hypothetical protein